MAIVMNMSSYEIERTSETIECDKPSLINEWRPTTAQLSLLQYVASNKHGSMPAHLATVDIDSFLHSMTK